MYVGCRAFTPSPAYVNFLVCCKEVHHNLVVVLITLIIFVSVLSCHRGPPCTVGVVQCDRPPCPDGAMIDLHVTVQQVEDYIPLVSEAGSHTNNPAIVNVGDG
jgi:hypothetical protein